MPSTDHLTRSTSPSQEMSSSPTRNQSSPTHLLTRHQYAPDHILQSYELYIPPPPRRPAPVQPSDEGPKHDGIWLIHIHGGAWRDPTITARDSFAPTLSHLLNPAPPSPPANRTSNSQPITNRISGYASLDYRLSPHPSHPQPSDTTPASQFRRAKHPDHISDILTALRVLQAKYGFGGRYILVGHSCGGTLAWQVAMRTNWSDKASRGSDADPDPDAGGEGVQQPMAIVSVCSLYDIPLLVQTHAGVLEFTEAAFGPEEERVWEDVSPARWADYGSSWKSDGGSGVPVAVLAHSTEDELVQWGQVVAMERALKGQQRRRRGDDNGSSGWDGIFQVLELKGSHEQVWQQGEQMARAITLALDMLDISKSDNSDAARRKDIP